MDKRNLNDCCQIDECAAYGYMGERACRACAEKPQTVSMPPLPDGLDDENINHYYFKRGWIECWQAQKLQFRSDKIALLEKYTTFLQKHGYIDTDATCEEPFAIDEFLRAESKLKGQAEADRSDMVDNLEINN